MYMYKNRFDTKYSTMVDMPSNQTKYFINKTQNQKNETISIHRSIYYLITDAYWDGLSSISTGCKTAN